MDEAYSTPGCKGGAGDSTKSRQAVGSTKQAATARMTEMEVAGAPFGFRIRNEHFVSGIDGNGRLPGHPGGRRGTAGE